MQTIFTAGGTRWRGHHHWIAAVALACALLVVAGCAKFNTYFNAKKHFDQAENVREEAIRNHQDPPKPSGAQKTDYDTAIRKAQKILDEYPGHSLTDDALFLQAKAYHRLESYRMSIRKFDLLFTNFPATPFQEEALYLQALNYLLIGGIARSQEYLDRLASSFPESEYQAETLKVSGDNAFKLENWEEAVVAFTEYLENHPEAQERDRIGLRLARCYWELQDYFGAQEVLQEVSANTTSAELGFRTRLLHARVNVKIEDFEVADVLVTSLKDEAQIYQAQGEVQLVEAESLIGQGRGADASPLLENMPTEWETPVVKARANDMLGYLYLERGELEEAKIGFTNALRRKDDLDDPERTRRLNENLTDYLAADKSLIDAPPERIPRLKLLQANAMLFGFQRPSEAAQLYVSAGADSAADSTIAPRALFGAVITYRDYLDEPDSAEIYRTDLIDRFPDSPQAFELSQAGGGDLLGYLLDRQQNEQQIRLANLTDDERAALTAELEAAATGPTAATVAVPGLRRRMVYLSRRPNLLFEPPQVAVDALAARQADARAAALVSLEQRQSATALADSLAGSAEVDSLLLDPDHEALFEPGTSSPDDTEGAAVDPADDEVAEQQDDETKEEEKEEQTSDWDLR